MGEPVALGDHVGPDVMGHFAGPMAEAGAYIERGAAEPDQLACHLALPKADVVAPVGRASDL